MRVDLEKCISRTLPMVNIAKSSVFCGQPWETPTLGNPSKTSQLSQVSQSVVLLLLLLLLDFSCSPHPVPSLEEFDRPADDHMSYPLRSAASFHHFDHFDELVHKKYYLNNGARLRRGGTELYLFGDQRKTENRTFSLCIINMLKQVNWNNLRTQNRPVRVCTVMPTPAFPQDEQRSSLIARTSEKSIQKSQFCCLILDISIDTFLNSHPYCRLCNSSHACPNVLMLPDQINIWWARCQLQKWVVYACLTTQGITCASKRVRFWFT